MSGSVHVKDPSMDLSLEEDANASDDYRRLSLLSRGWKQLSELARTVACCTLCR